MPVYDSSQFDPPAPLAQVTLRNLGSSAIRSDVPMLVDSGADKFLSIPCQTQVYQQYTF